jgi:hypothetical protein
VLAAIAGLMSTATPATAQSVTIWPTSATPQSVDSDQSAVELGVRFRSDVAGTVNGVRFYKYVSNTGTHIGNLWTNGGTKLATATFTSETTSGWQQVTFSTPVAIAAGTTYVVSYHTNTGHYGTTTRYFDPAGFDRAPLHALSDFLDGGNGVYHYGSASAFPDHWFQSTNYWVDVVFTPSGVSDTTPPTITSALPANSTTIAPGTNVTATFSEAMNPSTINTTTFELRGPAATLVAGTVGYDNAGFIAIFIPVLRLAEATSYTATVKTGVTDVAGNAMASAVTWSFTTAAPSLPPPTPPPPAPATCPCSIWDPLTTTPANQDGDSSAVELGVRFQTDTAGYISGFRFYKFAANTGAHFGSLWSNTGTLLARATFSNESSTGWQEVTFSPGVAVTANTTYVASYHTDTGHYAATGGFFAAGVDHAPLHALRDGVDGRNGVYRYGAIGFPDQTYQSANYWVDPVFTTTQDSTVQQPRVFLVEPSVGATNVLTGKIITAYFAGDINLSTITSTTFEVRDSSGALVSGSLDKFMGETGMVTAIVTPKPSLAYSTTYTATLKGGPNGIKDPAGNPMKADYVWSFTTVYAPPPAGTCTTTRPCQLWTAATTPAGAADDGSAVELGVKFQSSLDGYITALRFYKVAGDVGPHVGELWDRFGRIIRSQAFVNESASGWQRVTLSFPVPISAGVMYVAAYHTPLGRYAVNPSYFATEYVNTPLRALADSEGGNGVYRYGPSGSFPNQTFDASNYWVDAEFATSLPDTTLPLVLSRNPEAFGASIATNVTAVFSELMDPATISAATFELRDEFGALVPATVTYNVVERKATLDPSGALAYSTNYRVILRGGTTGPRVMDLAGNSLAATTPEWGFGTRNPPTPIQGPGGPIIVLTSASSPYSSYYPEILRAEGLNVFEVFNVTTTVDAAWLSQFNVVILGEMPISAAQAAVYADWVNLGGNLIAMRPDTTLSALLGLGTKSSSTVANGYVVVDGSAPPGAGLAADTLQFHGTADAYTLAGATTVATLYSDAVTATSFPAVTLNSVGTKGGEAAAFTYDLARSIVHSRQGDPAMPVQNRDGVAPITPADLLFGAANPGKIAIPQADEQQRLLVNLVLRMNRDRTPLPRFWYFPRGAKAVVVMTGEKHLSDAGEVARLDGYKAASAAGCSVANWECIRATAYLAADTTISNAAAAAYQTDGFELAAQVDTGCIDWTALSLPTTYSAQLTAFATAFPGLQAQRTHRIRCSVWSDYATQPAVEFSRGIRLDTSYSGLSFFTGSGMPMRFAGATGGLIDVYQAATQVDATLGESDPAAIDALLAKAVGPEGYYGAFTANVQADASFSASSDQIIASAKARGVPVIAVRQLLDWVDGRNQSSFQSLTWTGDTLTFAIAIGPTAIGLQAMLPSTMSAGSLATLTLNGSAVAFTKRTIKGVEYVLFQAAAGTYRAIYMP